MDESLIDILIDFFIDSIPLLGITVVIVFIIVFLYHTFINKENRDFSSQKNNDKPKDLYKKTAYFSRENIESQNRFSKNSAELKAFIVFSIMLIESNKNQKDELKVLWTILSRNFGRMLHGMQLAYIKKMIHNFTAKDARIVISKTSQKYRETFIYSLIKIAIADEQYTPDEERIINQICYNINVNKSFLKKAYAMINIEYYKNIYNVRQKYSYDPDYSVNKEIPSFTGDSISQLNQKEKKLSRAYLILGLSEDCEITNIKKTYRNLAHTYHPDKHQGKTDFLLNQAEEIFKNIQNAYELIKEEKGFN